MVEVIVKMGYGGTRKDAGRAIGKSGDGGIDGIIKAEDYVSRIDAKVVLIDGETLAQLMIDHNVGVSTVGAYEIKKIDSDYFAEE